MISSNFLASLERYMLRKGYTVFNGSPNIAVLEGSNPDGTLNSDAFDRFNDLLLVWDSLNGQARLLGSFVCTCEPGRYYTDKPMNPGGAARIKLGQYTAWRFGLHQGKYEALVQVKPVTVVRDKNKDGFRTGDREDTGLFGINIHHGNNTPIGGSIGRWSAGCTVIPSVSEFNRFLNILKSSSVYKMNRSHTWTVAFIDASDFKKFREAK